MNSDGAAAVLSRGGDPRHPAQLRVAMVAGLAAGGTARHVAALAAGCRDAGLAVSVLAPVSTLAVITKSVTPAATPRPHGDGEPLATRPLPVADRPRPVRDVASLARLRGWLTSWRPDVVHAHGVRAGALAAAAIALMPRIARPALVVTVHNAPPDGRAAAGVHGVLERVCARRADLVLCASADLAARLLARGAGAVEQVDVPAQRSRKPDAAQTAAVRRELGAGARPVVLAVGRLARQKGLDVLAAAATRWQDRDPRPITVIAGAGPMSGLLREHARGVADGDVRLLGARDDVPVLLAAADVVVVPSRWEARALIVQEAMHAGRPIVATRVGGIPDLTGEDGAVLVEPDDPAALAAAVTAVLDDPALAARLGSAASSRAASFPSPEDVLTGMMVRYARLAAGRRQPR